MSLAAGSLNRLFRFWTPTGTKLPSGQVDPAALTLVGDKWGNFKSETGMGTIRNSRAQGVNSEVARVSIRVRYWPAADTSLIFRQVLQGAPTGLWWTVDAVRHDEENREWTDLVCQSAEPGAYNAD